LNSTCRKGCPTKHPSTHPDHKPDYHNQRQTIHNKKYTFVFFVEICGCANMTTDIGRGKTMNAVFLELAHACVPAGQKKPGGHAEQLALLTEP
jgi:hypothetical protein